MRYGSNKSIDELIREALSDADAEVLERLGEPSISEIVIETFRGRHRVLTIGGVVATLALFFTGLFAAVRFVQGDDVPTMLVWGGAAALCFAGVLAFKVWYWIEMARLALSREVKRLELQLAQLARELGERADP